MANLITFLRIPLAISMLCMAPFSTAFWIIYFICGITDMLDGLVARTLRQESANGAKLDSIADFVFAVSVATFVIINIEIPTWLWLCTLGIAILRFISYGIGFYKYHTFASLHTYANKITGAFIYMAPIIYCLCGLTVTGMALCVVAFYSSVEELAITIKSKVLNRDCKSILIYHLPAGWDR